MYLTKAVILLPEELILIDGVLEWTGGLEKEKEETFQIAPPHHLHLQENIFILKSNITHDIRMCNLSREEGSIPETECVQHLH